MKNYSSAKQKTKILIIVTSLLLAMSFIIPFGGRLVASADNNIAPVSSSIDWEQIAGFETAYATATTARSMALSEDGRVYAWGLNQANARLGTDSMITPLHRPQRVMFSPSYLRMQALSVGNDFSLAICTDGYLYSWGSNTNGRLGDGTLISRDFPERVGTDNNWVHIDSGTTQSVAINSDGEMFTWGHGGNGVLGHGNTNHVGVPTKVGTASNWTTAVVGSDHMIALNNLGQIYAWGRNHNGQIGQGFADSLNPITTPVRVGDRSDWTYIATGSSTNVAIDSLGRVYTWGSSSNSRLGRSVAVVNAFTPGRINTAADGDEEIIAVTVDINEIGAAITADGRLFTWGRGQDGRRGAGENDVGNVVRPSRIGHDQIWTSVSVAIAHSFAINDDGELFGWGLGTDARIGDRSGATLYVPTMLASRYGEFDELTSGIRELMDRIEALEAQVSSLESQVSALNNTITGLENQITTLNTTVTNLETEISSLEDDIQDYRDAIDDLEDEIEYWTLKYAATRSSLEGQISTLETNLTNAQNSYNTLLADKTALEISLNGQISALQSQVATLEYDYAALGIDNAAQVAALNGQIDDLTAQLTTLAEDYAELQADKTAMQISLNGQITVLEAALAALATGNYANVIADLLAKIIVLETTAEVMATTLENRQQTIIGYQNQIVVLSYQAGLVAGLVTQVETLEETIIVLNSIIAELQAEIEVLRNNQCGEDCYDDTIVENAAGCGGCGTISFFDGGMWMAAIVLLISFVIILVAIKVNKKQKLS